jgi:hypothetical protein
METLSDRLPFTDLRGNGVSFVSIVLEKINGGFSHIMAAARRSTRYETENLPAQTREYFNTVGVPEYRF